MNSEQHADDLHRLFIAQVVQTGSVWALRADDGFAVSPSNEYDEAEVIPFWSNADAARSLATDEWAAYEPVEIPLAEFLETWMLGMQHEDLLVGTNWDAELAGSELEPIELAYVLATRLLEGGQAIELEHFESLEQFQGQLKEVIEADKQ